MTSINDGGPKGKPKVIDGGFAMIPREEFLQLLVGKSDKLTEVEARLWLILDSSFAERDKTIKGIKVRLRRGQNAYSVRFLAKAWRWPATTVFKFLRRLAAEGIIKRGTQKGTPAMVITICDYDCIGIGQEKRGTAKGTNQKKVYQNNVQYSSIGIDAKSVGGEGDFRDRGEPLPLSNSTSTSPPAESLWSECYRLAEEYEAARGGNPIRGAKLVSMARGEGAEPDDVEATIIQAREDDIDLGDALAEFWKHRGAA
jgi:hypothetical protein